MSVSDVMQVNIPQTSITVRAVQPFEGGSGALRREPRLAGGKLPS
jgi:hypothetical protein